LLQVLDQQWKEHLLSLDQLRQGISLRAYAQKDPLNEYKREAFLMFESMLASMRETTSMVLSHVELRTDTSDDGQTVSDRSIPKPPSQKIARNASCPCGSGKKYKHCCGAIVA
jgi:preprotein translocase subunit SecA